MVRLKNVLDNPIVSQRDYGKALLQSVGHADLVEDNDNNWWIVALATRPYKHRHHLGRETILLPVTWSKDGWPMVEGKQAKDSYKIQIKDLFTTKKDIHDTFKKTKLSYEYNTIRSFLNDYYEIKNQQLVLYGNKQTLNTHKSPVFIGVRQTEKECYFETQLSVSLKPSSSAGLAIIMDCCHHMEIGITSQNELYVKKTVADLVNINIIEKVIGKIIIGIEANQEYYQFYYQKDNQKYKVDQTYVKHLCTETCFSAFCGVYGGMFIEGEGKAVFDYFHYQEK